VRDPVRVVGRRIPRQRGDDGIGLAAASDRSGKATRVANNTRAWAHQFTAVLQRYLLAGLGLGVAAWALTSLLWVTLVAAGLPLVVCVWWLNQVRRQARAHRRGYGPPPPGYLGRF
jgi:hypothetical protein